MNGTNNCKPASLFREKRGKELLKKKKKKGEILCVFERALPENQWGLVCGSAVVVSRGGRGTGGVMSM